MDENRIRKRGSYVEFDNFLSFLNTRPSKKKVLYKLHEIIDGRRAYGSQTNSDYALESLRLLIKDKKLR